ncbi:MAG: metalloregulator ArsR/SmtB family transcription factor [Proteobacteria bacterium]|nr:metalloregulator ArsR/SmtB family transcription factor [Pseudomonadota bacterium]
MVTHYSESTPAEEAESRVFRALSDPSRRRILDRLLAGDASVNELAEGFATSRPAVSRHLRVLREATLVVERRSGRRRVYSLNPLPMAGADAWLAKYRSFWAARLHALKALAEASPIPQSQEDPP